MCVCEGVGRMLEKPGWSVLRPPADDRGLRGVGTLVEFGLV